MQTQTIITILFWLLAAGFIAINYLHGFQKIFAQKQKVEMFTRLGYSITAMRFIGLVEVITSSLILLPKTRLFSISIYAVLLSGAIYTHLKIKDERNDTMGPVIAGVWLTVVMIVNCWVK